METKSTAREQTGDWHCTLTSQRFKYHHEMSHRGSY